MRLRTLGGLTLEDSSFTRPKPLLLLGYLALEGARDRHHISELFFARASDGMNSLRTTLKRLRQETPGVFHNDGDPLRASVECDAQQLLAQLETGDLQAATQGYAGAFLAGVHLPDWSVELEEWVYATREFIASRVRGALLILAEREAAKAEFATAAQLAERACWLEGAPDPEPEEFVRLGALLSAGQSPMIGRLREQARGFAITLELSSDAARQKLLGRLDAPSRAALPLRGTSFVGRITERPQIAQALARDDVRLLSLIGPGGIGKTRLALELARDTQLKDGAIFISLEAMTALSHLPNAVALALSRTLTANAEPFHALVELLHQHAVLLVLDSVEHLLEGAPYLPRLLRECPKLKLLVTSRERLGLEEEWVFHVGGLSQPPAGATLEQALGFEAVQLFAQRAKRARLSFNLTPDDLPAVLRVCELVGGSPLGLELAAAWVKLISVAEIAEEISHNLNFLETTNRDVPTRHHSLRAVFEQSWARLNPAEKRIFARLSVFRGGFNRESAAEVAGATLAILSSLNDKSLLRVSEAGRYDIHVLLHQFALETLSQNPEESERTSSAHDSYVFAFTKRATEAIRTLDAEKYWLGRLDQELENIRLALTRWLEKGDTNQALDCASMLRNFWLRTGRTREAISWLSRGLSMVGNTKAQVREGALVTSGQMARNVGRYPEAQALLEEALRLGEVRGDVEPIIFLHLGLIAQTVGDLQLAVLRFEQALVAFREKGIAAGVAASLNNLGSLLISSGNLKNALRTFEKAMQYKLASGGDTESVTINLGDVHLRLGNLELAKDYLTRGLAGLFTRGLNSEIAKVLEKLGELAAIENGVCRVATLVGAASSIRETLNTHKTPAEQQRLEQNIATTRAALGDIVFNAAWSEGRAMTLEQAVTYALNSDDE